MKMLGVSALACYAIHGGYHLYHGRPEDLLWICHLGAALIGVGLLASSMTLSGVGTLFLCMGTPMWLLELAGGGEFMPTSLFTHIGALSIGLYAARRWGMPAGVWWKAFLGVVFIMALSRLVTPAHANVNVAFAIQAGWEGLYPNYPVYVVSLLCTTAVYFFVVERVLRRWLVDPQLRKAAS